MEIYSDQLIDYIGVLEEADKAFVGDVAKDYIATAQADIFFQLGVRNKDLMRDGLALIGASTSTYQKSMLDIVGAFEKGTIDYATAFSNWRDATKTAMNGMYRGGGMSVGNPFFRDLKIPTADLRLMSKYLNKEGEYFKQFLRDIKNPKHMAKIPKGADGKNLPGYNLKHFGYQERAGFYPESMKAMRYNGMVRGSGSNMEVFWVLGSPQTEHCVDCPVLSGRSWTGETLPTVPGAGDTKCLHKCYCSLEFRQKISRTTFDIAGSATRGALAAPGRQARVLDSQGNEVGGALQFEIEELMGKMYHARQMIELTTGAAKAEWIAERKRWNALVIDRAKQANVRVLPTISSAALVKTARAIAAKGGTLVTDFSTLYAGQEVWFARGDFSSFGVIEVFAGAVIVKFPTGINLRPSPETDVVYDAKKGDFE